MNKRKRLTATVCVLTVVIFVLMGITFASYRSDNESLQGNNIVNVVVTPMQKFFSSIGNGMGDFFSYIKDMKTYKEENLELKEQVASLSRQIRENNSYKQENERLRALLELKENDIEGRKVFCEVVAKDPGNWFDVFTIDKGKNHGIRKNDAVVTNEGLVGKVFEVGENWAKVTTIIDTKSSVSAIVERTQDIVLIEGDLSLADQGKCRLGYIKGDVSIVAGDTIETSGLGGIYPKGILIGTVEEVKNDSLGYSKYAIVDTKVNFEKIREVAVIKSSN